MAIKKNSKAYARLRKKFDALRATLPDDERLIFDEIVSNEPEVTGHKIAVKKVARAKKRSASEVEAHKMGVKGATRKTANKSKMAVEK